MAFDAFPTSPSADLPFEITLTPRILKAQFGDGYSQRTKDGQNASPRSVGVSWTHISEAEKDVIDGFLASKEGYIPFTYTLVGETTNRQWTCEKWSKTTVAYQVWNLTAEFIENYDI